MSELEVLEGGSRMHLSSTLLENLIGNSDETSVGIGSSVSPVESSARIVFRTDEEEKVPYGEQLCEKRKKIQFW